MKEKKQESGGKRLMDKGKKPVLLGLQQAEYDQLRKAADEHSQPMTRFIIDAALRHAKRFFHNFGKKA